MVFAMVVKPLCNVFISPDEVAFSWILRSPFSMRSTASLSSTIGLVIARPINKPNALVRSTASSVIEMLLMRDSCFSRAIEFVLIFSVTMPISLASVSGSDCSNKESSSFIVKRIFVAMMGCSNINSGE